jgi:hypothetical protein
MSTNQKIFNDVTQFLESIAPEVTVPELVKPFPESKLHEMTVDELNHNLYEARRVQHLLPQFSKAETAHFQFVDESIAIIAYKQLDELNKTTLGSYVKKAADSGMDHSYKAGASVTTRPEDSKKHAEKSLTRFKGILRASAKLTKEEVEPLDELSRATLNAYAGKSTEEVGNYEKDHSAKMSTVAKRIKGALLARKKLKTKTREHAMDEAANHDDEAEDKQLIKKMVKKDALKEETVDHSNRQLFEDAAAAAETDARYKIVRMYNKGERSHTIKRGLSLADAKAHCSNPETSSLTATSKSNVARTQRMGHWFDGYDNDK